MDASPIPTPAQEDAPSEPLSLLDRLTGVITGPTEVFEEVKRSPVRASNWLVPLILVCLGAVFYTVMAFSQPGVNRPFEEAREKAMQKLVADGKMTQAQVDQAMAVGSRITKIVAPFGAVFATAVGIFLLAVAIWLALKLSSEAKLDYMKIVEVCGLAAVIDVPQKIIRTWLVTWKENMLSTLSPTLLLANPDMHSKRDIFLSMIDPIDFWWLAVLSLGISKVASISFQKAALICFGIWYGFRVIAALLTPAQ
jgi:hypothetical protein